MASDRNLVDVRFPVQYVIRPQRADHRDHRSYAGTIAGGILRPGDEVVVLPSRLTTRITGIDGPTGPLEEAFPPMAVAITVADDIDISRGDLIARPGNQPRLTQDIDAMVCWMSDSSVLSEGGELVIKHTTRTTRATVVRLDYELDINTLNSDRAASRLSINEIGRVRLRTQVPLIVDEYRRNEVTGSFILIDPVTNNTVGAGMLLADPHGPPASSPSRPASPDIVRHASLVTAEERLSRGVTVWFTGLSGSGKSTVAGLAERLLLREGRPAYVLDGDNLRHGLNGDLAFSMDDRAENLRRIAHVAQLLADAGLIVLVPAISPLRAHRDLARRIHHEAGIDFLEVYVDTPIDVCESRDPKGLYAEARAGHIINFTGVDSPYEPPHHPDLRLRPDLDAEAQANEVVVAVASARGID